MQPLNLDDMNLARDDLAGDRAREAVAALRGFAYQLYASALAWLALKDGEQLHLEVAEDFAVVARDAMTGVQVKSGPGKITIRSKGVVATINSLVELTAANHSRHVSVRYLTTANIGRERAKAERTNGEATLLYWRRAAAGADVAPLREVLLASMLKETTKDFIRERTNEQLRADLLRRIYWDCGQPPLEGLDRELEDAVVEFATTTLRLGSDAAVGIKAAILNQIMRAASQPEDRSLRRADLVKLAEGVTMVTVPRSILRGWFTAAPSGQLIGARLLTRGGDVEPHLTHIKRGALLTEVRQHLNVHGAVLISGSTGIGKTALARDAALGLNRDWFVADFRGLESKASADRLRDLRSEVLVEAVAVLLLDDLDTVNDPLVLSELCRLFTVLRRRDGLVLVTCSADPAPSTLGKLTGGLGGHIAVPYLTVEEVEELLRSCGGPPQLGSIVWAASSGGHPQLVQAAVLYLNSTGWDRQVAITLLSSDAQGVAAEKAIARERLIGALDEQARMLLYRTSLVSSRFPRSLPLALAVVPTPLRLPGEALDRLTGPWLETLDQSELRVSPLVANAGVHILSSSEQQAVHQEVVRHQLANRSLSAADSDLVLHHALAGGDPTQILAFASAVVTADFEMLPQVGRHSLRLRRLPTDRPATDNPFAAAMLRLAQFLVLVTSGSPEAVQATWKALEIESGPDSGTKGMEVLVVSKALLLNDLSRKFPDWLDLLVRFDQLAQDCELLGEAVRTMEGGAIDGPASSFFFLVQVSGLDRVAALREAFRKLDGIDPAIRARLLSGTSRARGFSFVINSVWLKDVKHDGFDAEAAAVHYKEMGNFAERWLARDLALRCHIASAIMLDEYVKSPDRAIECLAEVEGRLGHDPLLARARAKIWWRRNQHADALREFEQLKLNDLDDLVERAHVAREAGVSAAALGRWVEAAKWFELGRSDGLAVGHEIMSAMAIGLGADAAQAMHKAGDSKAAIDLYSRALIELRSLDPDSSLQAAYVHRLVRHAVLWLLTESGENAAILSTSPMLPAGACSNPDPSEQIREFPLAVLDLAWYLLAQAEQAFGLPPDIDSKLDELVRGGPMTSLEVGRAYRRVERAIQVSDSQHFLNAVPDYLAAVQALATRRQELFGPVEEGMVRGPLAPVDLSVPLSPVIEDAMRNALISFCLVAALRGLGQRIEEVCLKLPPILRCGGIVAAIMGTKDAATEHEMLGRQLIQAASGRLADPAEALSAAMRFVMFARTSGFRRHIEKPLADWVVGTWTVITREQRFRLILPNVYSALIEEELGRCEPTLNWMAHFCLVALPATQLRIGDGVRDALLAADVEQSQG